MSGPTESEMESLRANLLAVAVHLLSRVDVPGLAAWLAAHPDRRPPEVRAALACMARGGELSTTLAGCLLRWCDETLSRPAPTTTPAALQARATQAQLGASSPPVPARTATDVLRDVVTCSPRDTAEWSRRAARARSAGRLAPRSVKLRAAGRIADSLGHPRIADLQGCGLRMLEAERAFVRAYFAIGVICGEVFETLALDTVMAAPEALPTAEMGRLVVREALRQTPAADDAFAVLDHLAPDWAQVLRSTALHLSERRVAAEHDLGATVARLAGGFTPDDA